MNELRAARKLCRMTIFDVVKGIGFYRMLRTSKLGVVTLSDIENGGARVSKYWARRLFDFYEQHERPPRFEGKYKTVAELKADWMAKNE